MPINNSMGSQFKNRPNKGETACSSGPAFIITLCFLKNIEENMKI